MSKYIFLLGQNPDLAKAELSGRLKNIANISQDFIIANCEEEPQALLDTLGGTIKIASFEKTVQSLADFSDEAWQKHLLKSASGAKINFGFSLYGDSQKHYRDLVSRALTIKKNLKKDKISSRLVVGQDSVLSSVIVSKNNLLNKELIIIKDQDKYILGWTQAIQNFSSYGQRDVGRPERDEQSGMLPPKVAQMMINLTGAAKNRNILDPFCGSGTILQEAALLGFKEIFGSDSSAKAATDTKKNLAWLSKNFNIKPNYTIKNCAVADLSKNFPAHSIDLIVSEPFMGDARVLQRLHGNKSLEAIAQNLRQLYIQAFTEFKKILKANGRIVFIFPVICEGDQQIYTLPALAIKKMGYTPILAKFPLTRASQNGHLLYARPQQKVQREIAVYQIQSN